MQRIVLITNFFRDSNQERYEEYRECLRRNCANRSIDQIVLVVEDGAESEPLLQHERISVIRVPKGRQKYSDFVAIANERCPGAIVVLCNSDIYFDESLERLRSFDMQRTLYCLTRREVLDDGRTPLTIHQVSSDAWVATSPIVADNIDIELGKMHCESLFIGRMYRAGYKVRNVSLDVACYHQHLTNIRNYDGAKDKYTQYEEMMYPVLSGEVPPDERTGCDDGPILIDTAVFQSPELGPAGFWLDTMRQWTNSPFAKELLVLDRAAAMPADIVLPKVEAPCYNHFLHSSSNELNGKLARRARGRLYVSTAYSSALGIPNVAVVLDATPEVVQADLDGKIFTRSQCMQFADYVLCGSEALRSYFEQRYQHRGPSRFHHVPFWHGGVEVISGLNARERAGVRHQFGLSRPYIVIGGERVGPFANKNLGIVADALRQGRDLGVVFAGGSEQLEPAIAEAFSGLILAHVPSTSEALAFYLAGAELYVQPAFGEEQTNWIHVSLACGCPALMAAWSDLQRDGGGVRYFDPHVVGGFGRRLDDVLSVERDVMVQEAFARASREVVMPNHERLELVLRAIAGGNPIPNVNEEIDRRLASMNAEAKATVNALI